jgi:hypothetical protein
MSWPLRAIGLGVRLVCMKATIFVVAIVVGLFSAAESDAYPGATCLTSAGCWKGEVCMVTHAGRPGTCVRLK